jgi:hypothetical protein
MSELNNEFDYRFALVIEMCKALDVEKLKEKYTGAQKYHTNYEAIGILDGYKYLEKSTLQEIALKRTKKLIEFLEVLVDTEPEVIRITKK